MPNIFISYRRDDSLWIAGRMLDRLCSEFGSDSVFMDVDAIPLGMDFRRALEIAVHKADLMLVLIGRDWAGTRDHDGQRRIDDPNDFVRMEVEYALQSQMTIIPVLVDGANMPSPGEVPASLRQLLFRNSVTISRENFGPDCDKLIRGLRTPIPPRISKKNDGSNGGWRVGLISVLASALGVRSALRDSTSGAPLKEEIAQAALRSAIVPKHANKAEHGDVFISYSRDDASMMHKVRQWLTKSNITVWTDDRLEPGTPSWKKAVQSAIENSTCFVILLTPSAKESDVVEMELGYALAHERIVLPVLAQGTNRTAVPLEIINRQWTDITVEFDAGMTRLVEAVAAYRSGIGLKAAPAMDRR